MFPKLQREKQVLIIAAMFLAVCTACSSLRSREQADIETYGILEEKREQVPGADFDFNIDIAADAANIDSLPRMDHMDPELGTGLEDETGLPILDLEKALILASQYNRSYQNAKESLYLQALSLTLDRHRYAPIFSGGANAAVRGIAVERQVPSEFNEAMGDVGTIIASLESLTGTQQALLRAYADVVQEAGNLARLDQPRVELARERQVVGSTVLGVDLLMKGGGRIAAALTTDFLRFLSGDSRAAAGSALSATLTQPLLRGAGRDIAAEQLTQAERDTLYALRDYTHYRKQFAVQVCSAYYGVLQQRDVVRNTWRGMENFRKNVERERAFAEEGLRTQAELGRMAQAQLDSENRYINAVRRYQEELDQFKLLLGLSTDTPLLLDDNELRQLQEQELNHPEVASEDAVRVALVSRLDLYNDRDRVEDAERRVKVAENALRPILNLLAGVSVPTEGENSIETFDFNRMTWNIGLDADPAFDKKPERNAYRAALIDRDRAQRRRSLAEDTVKLEVRAAWRNLEQARRAYEVALESVRLSERRVEEQRLLAELGMATAQDQVDAQNDLIQSRNNLTTALISHTLARLGFWRDMGMLYIGKDGLWQEVTEYTPDEQSL